MSLFDFPSTAMSSPKPMYNRTMWAPQQIPQGLFAPQPMQPPGGAPSIYQPPPPAPMQQRNIMDRFANNAGGIIGNMLRSANGGPQGQMHGVMGKSLARMGIF